MRRAVYGIAAVIVVGVALWLLWPRAEAPPAPPPPPVPVATREAPPAPPPRPVAPPRPTVFPQPNGEVLVERRVEDAAVYGRVRGAERLPDGEVFIEGCGVRAQQTPVDEDGTFFASVKVGRCELRAWRAHGALKIPGPWVSIDPQPGAEMDVDLSVPTFEPAGMGVRFEPVEGGVRISSVVAGSPAEGAGIEPGDLVTRVDGVPTDGMDVDTFLQHGLGPAGSPVEIQGVKANGEAFRAVMNREKVSD